MVLVCLTRQQTHQTWTPERIYEVLSRGKWEKNADELKATVKETWASKPPQQCHKLNTSMPRRIEAVIQAKGAPPQVLSTYTENEHTFQKANNSLNMFFLLVWSILISWDSELVFFC